MGDDIHSSMTGHIRLDDEGDGLSGTIVDSLGYVQRITGTPTPGGGWTLAVTVFVPVQHRLPWEADGAP